MAKIIAVWGSPNSGKTTFAIKLAKYIYENHSASILVLSPDFETPTLPLLFPNETKEKLISVGTALSKPVITEQDIVKCVVSYKGKTNLGVLGYSSNENKYTYPRYDSNKAKMFIDTLKNIVDYVIVDCSSYYDNVLSNTALELADNVISLAVPNTKSMIWFASQLPLYGDSKYNINSHIKVMNLNEDCKYIYYPLNETKTHYKNISYSLPFCSELIPQFINGELLGKVTNKKYIKLLNILFENIISK